MKITSLDAPITVMAGLGIRRELTTLFDLLDFLNEWPHARRGPIYLTAHRACSAAVAGQLTTEQARQSFIAFARVSNTLLGCNHPSPRAGTAARVSIWSNGLPTASRM